MNSNVNLNTDYDTNDIPKIGLCGFNNIGNTCYLNSILQLLIHSKVFVSFLLQNDFINYLEKASTQNIADLHRQKNNIDENTQITINKSDIDNLMNYSIISRLYEIVLIIINKGNSTISPVKLKESIKIKGSIDRKFESFRGFMQEDAHEFLIKLLDEIIIETGIKSKSTFNNVPDIIHVYKKLSKDVKQSLLNATDNDQKKIIIKSLNDFKINNKDIINKYNGLVFMSNIFKEKHNPFIFNLYSIIIYKLVCLNCNDINVNYEYHTILSIQVKNTVYDGFNAYFESEEVESKCSCCNTSKKIKSIKIWKPSMLLFVHLNRFENLQDPNNLKKSNIRKINTIVDIPLELDISDFYDSSMLPDVKYNKYKLKGYANHRGSSPHSGHYTADAMCINDNTWFHFDDSNVSKYNGNNINTSLAYVLMYEIDN